MKLIIFTYCPTGLGHLRVTDALAGARPKDCPYVVLGSYDRFMTWIHRFTSINPIGKFLFISSQYGILEDILTLMYRFFLRVNSGGVYKQILEVINKNTEVDDFQIVATHPGMAHQIGAVKERLLRETGKNINLIVQVTDDTYQHVWLVDGADLTIVPSKFVKKEFVKYAKSQKIKFVSEVVPYPIGTTLTEKLPVKWKRAEAFDNPSSPINIIVPISGAATGLSYAIELIRHMVKISSRFKFWVIVKKASYTDFFVSVLLRIPGVNIVVGKNDNEMINLYELIYEQNLILLEVTKPSEQAFKSIIEPNRIGGSILLFVEPVGRQEIENIHFLRRHRLVKKIGSITKSESYRTRSLILDNNPLVAGDNILNCVTAGIFKNMVDEDFKFSKKSLSSGEIGSSGAEQFWRVVKKYFG